MGKITVWTKQNEAVLKQLEENGRFIAVESYMRKAMEDTSDIMIFIYRWLASHMPTQSVRPADAVFPVWVSLIEEATMMPEKGSVILELSVDRELMALCDITKWTRITNYSYIPVDKEDADRHSRLLSDYGTDDVKAVMTPFYPQIKRKVIDSWDRLFDNEVVLEDAGSYGLLWEVRKEWVTEVRQWKE